MTGKIGNEINSFAPLSNPAPCGGGVVVAWVKYLRMRICSAIQKIFNRLGLVVTLTHQNRSYRDSETKENVEAQKRKQRGENDRKRTSTTTNKLK